MLFTSLPFILLMAVTLAIYYLPFLRKYQIGVLILAGFVFYAFKLPWLLVLLNASILINAICSYLVQYPGKQNKKTVATLGVIINLGLLAFFKYSSLLAITLLPKGDSFSEFLIHIPLPIGISFFTFQGISLLVDVYREPEKSLRQGWVVQPFWWHWSRTAFFIAFFPHSIAGPIVKAHDFMPQIGTKTLLDIDWNYAFRKLVLGYFLKLGIADNIKDTTFDIAYPYFERHSSPTLITMLYGYSFQIFADFAGYSLIAMGLAALFGYRLQDNFNFPYISASFSEFWQRWHISLSGFLREYLYIPLGGNRKGATRTYINLMIVMLLGGLWHGAAWSYMVWGGVHGLALAIERFTLDKIRLPDNNILKALRIFLIFNFVTLAWLFFKLPDINHVGLYLLAIAKNWRIYPIINVTIFIPILFMGMVIVGYHLHYLWVQSLTPARQTNWTRWYPIGYGLMLFWLLNNSGNPGSFIYFQF